MRILFYQSSHAEQCKFYLFGVQDTDDQNVKEMDQDRHKEHYKRKICDNDTDK